MNILDHLEKRAARGTVKQLIRFLGGGAKGRRSLASLQNRVARWIAGGETEAPEALQNSVARLFYNSGGRIPANRVYGVLDPSGRLEQARLYRVVDNRMFDRNPVAAEDFPRVLRRGVGGDSVFEPLPELLEEDQTLGEAARMRADIGWRIPSAADHTNALRARLAELERKGIGPTHRMIERWTEPLATPILQAQAATVPLRPGETPVQAVRRDLMGRVWPGTPLAGRRGMDVLRHNRIALNGNGEVVRDDYFTLPEDRTLPQLSNVVGEHLSRNVSSNAGPYGVQTAAALSGDGVVYYPHFAMHEMGHGLQEWGNLGKPGAWRRNRAAAEEALARMRSAPLKGRAGFKPPVRLASRSHGAFNSRYAGKQLPPAYSWQRDPVQLFRQFSPKVYGEVAADVNAFGRNSRAWPQSVRRAMGTYLAGALRDEETLARMPGNTPAERLRALREYANMARGFTNAPELPYTTAWGGTPRWSQGELL